MHKGLQQKLLEAILIRYTKKSEAVEDLSEMLRLTKDAVYRRLRGDTVLAPDEIAELARSFNISLDALVFEQSNTVFFTYNAFSTGAANFDDYLAGFLKELEMAEALPLSKFYYASAELPLFDILFFPELISFKLYIWGRTVLDFEYLQDVKFQFNLIPPHIMQVTQKMLDVYIKLSSKELWSQNILDNTLNQIEYHVGAGSFKDDKDILILYDKLDELITHMQKMARYGHKFPLNADPEGAVGGNFHLYHNEMVHTNNTILAGNEEGQVLFTTLGNPNFLRSTDNDICNYIENWFKRLISKSNSISKHDERTREWFFNRIRKKIAFSRRRVLSELGMEME